MFHKVINSWIEGCLVPEVESLSAELLDTNSESIYYSIWSLTGA